MCAYATQVTGKGLLGVLPGVAIRGLIGLNAATISQLVSWLSDFQGSYAYVISWSGLILGLVHTLRQRRKIGRLFGHRWVRAIAITFGIVIIAGGVLVAMRQSRLSTQTLNALTLLNDRLEITVFDRSDEFSRRRQPLEEFKSASTWISTK